MQVLAIGVIPTLLFWMVWIVEAAQPGAGLPPAFKEGSHIKYMVALNCAAASPAVDTPFAVSSMPGLSLAVFVAPLPTGYG